MTTRHAVVLSLNRVIGDYSGHGERAQRSRFSSPRPLFLQQELRRLARLAGERASHRSAAGRFVRQRVQYRVLSDEGVW